MKNLNPFLKKKKGKGRKEKTQERSFVLAKSEEDWGNKFGPQNRGTPTQIADTDTGERGKKGNPARSGGTGDVVG